MGSATHGDNTNLKRRTLVHTRLANITDRRRLDHVTNSEALNGLVLRDASRAVGAADEVDVAAAVLVAAVVSSLLGLNAEGSATRLEIFTPALCHPESCLPIHHSLTQAASIPPRTCIENAP